MNEILECQDLKADLFDTAANYTVFSNHEWGFNQTFAEILLLFIATAEPVNWQEEVDSMFVSHVGYMLGLHFELNNIGFERMENRDEYLYNFLVKHKTISSKSKWSVTETLEFISARFNEVVENLFNKKQREVINKHMKYLVEFTHELDSLAKKLAN